MYANKITAFSLAALCALSMWLSPLPARAQDTVLFVSPTRVTMPDRERVTVVHVANKSSEPRRYDISVIDQVMNEEGMTQQQDNFDYSAKRMLRFQPKRFTLQPGERQAIRIMASRPVDLPDGDYHSHILFREVPMTQSRAQVEASKGVQFEIKAIYGVGIPITVEKGKVESSLALGDINYMPSSEGTPSHLAVQLLRSGNAGARGRISVNFVKAGNEPVTIVNRQLVPVYREVDKVNKRVSLHNLPQGMDLRGGKMVVELYRPETDPKDPARENDVLVETKELVF